VLLLLVVAAFNFLMQPQLSTMQQGQAAYLEGRSQDAVDAFSDVINKDENDYEAYLGRGFAYIQLSYFEAAKSDFGRALTLNPDNVNNRVYEQLGFIALNQEDNNAAIAYYDRVIDSAQQANTVSAQTYFHRGVAFFQRGDYEKALTDFELAVEIDDTSPIYFSRLGDAYYNLNRFTDARNAYEQYVVLEQPDLLQPSVMERLETLRGN
jgi:tetratricopeptide (TPR) repeat protein